MCVGKDSMKGYKNTQECKTGYAPLDWEQLEKLRKEHLAKEDCDEKGGASRIRGRGEEKGEPGGEGEHGGWHGGEGVNI